MQLKEYFFKISFLYKLIPVHFLMSLAGKKNIHLFYHFIDNGSNNFIKNLYKPKTKNQFIKDIHFLKTHFDSLPLKDLKSKDRRDNYGFFLSFDDGLSNFYNVIAPILYEENIYATNFLNSNFINNKELFYRYKVSLIINFIEKNDVSENKKKAIVQLLKLKKFTKKRVFNFLKKLSINETNVIDSLAKILNFSFVNYLKTFKPYLNEDQILKLIGKGFYFGAHSKNHPRYSKISLKNQLKETLESWQEISEKFNLSEAYFSFPFSDDGVTKEFFRMIKSKQIISFGSSGLKDEDLENHYQRIPMEYNKVYSAETIIKGELIYYILKKIFGKHKTIRVANFISFL